MAEITGITPQVKDKTRCNIEVDGRFYCGMKLETVMQNRLKVGMIVARADLARLQLESEKKTALDKALRHISVSMKTEKQIREYLAKKGYLSEISDYVIEKMREYHYIDDEEYARTYSETAGKRKGRRLIAAELKKKGVSDAAIESALASLTGERESAERVLEKYMRGKTADKNTLSKAYAYLLGKGYDCDTAKSAVQAMEAEEIDESSLTGGKESAERVLEKYMREKTADKKTLSKAHAYLLGKGYDSDTAKSALRALKEIDDETNFD